MREILQRTHFVLRERALSADVQDGTFRTKCRRDARDRVGAAGSGGRDHAPQLAGLPRITVGRMRRDLFVPHVDDADVFVDAAVVDIDDVTTAEREDGVDTLVLERLGDQAAAGNTSASRLFLCRVSSAVDVLG
jgi:hypothetical protein